MTEAGLSVQTTDQLSGTVSKCSYDETPHVDHLGWCKPSQDAFGSSRGSGKYGRLEMGLLYQFIRVRLSHQVSAEIEEIFFPSSSLCDITYAHILDNFNFDFNFNSKCSHM